MQNSDSGPAVVRANAVQHQKSIILINVNVLCSQALQRLSIHCYSRHTIQGCGNPKARMIGLVSEIEKIAASKYGCQFRWRRQGKGAILSSFRKLNVKGLCHSQAKCLGVTATQHFIDAKKVFTKINFNIQKVLAI